MPIVVGIRFRDSGKIYYFDPAGIDLRSGELAVVETVRGLEIGKVARDATEVPDSEIIGELKPVVRRPTASDFERMQHFSARQEEVLTVCAERITQHRLPMRLIKAEYNFDGSRLTFYFTAEQRIDFRALVRDLARTFRTRIELRQVGPRDEARLLGGIGPCGRPLCCATFLPDFARVSIKMAKDQDLPLNPSKISGLCGRLLCCLSYEHEQYLEIKAELPPRGAWVQTPEGPGEVLAVNVIREMVTVDVGGNYIDVTAEQIQEATTLVSGTARTRAQSGTAAPVTRSQPPEASPQTREAPTPEFELLDLIDAPVATPPPEPAPDRPPRHERGRQGRGPERPPRPAAPAPQQFEPHRLLTDELALPDLPELHRFESAGPAAEPEQRRPRRRRRRKKSGPDAMQQAAPERGQQPQTEAPAAPAADATAPSELPHGKRRSRPHRRRKER